MIHTLYRRATHTFHTPSWVTSYLLLVFLSSSSLQFVFSEQLGFEHQLRSQLLCSKLVSRSIKRQRIKNDKLRASSNQDQPVNHASTKQAKQQRFKVPQTAGLYRAALGQLFTSASVITGTLKPYKVSSGHLTGQANEGSRKQNLSHSTCQKLHTASEKEASQPF